MSVQLAKAITQLKGSTPEGEAQELVDFLMPLAASLGLGSLDAEEPTMPQEIMAAEGDIAPNAFGTAIGLRAFQEMVQQRKRHGAPLDKQVLEKFFDAREVPADDRKVLRQLNKMLDAKNLTGNPKAMKMMGKLTEGVSNEDLVKMANVQDIDFPSSPGAAQADEFVPLRTPGRTVQKNEKALARFISPEDIIKEATEEAELRLRNPESISSAKGMFGVERVPERKTNLGLFSSGNIGAPTDMQQIVDSGKKGRKAVKGAIAAHEADLESLLPPVMTEAQQADFRERIIGSPPKELPKSVVRKEAIKDTAKGALKFAKEHPFRTGFGVASLAPAAILGYAALNAMFGGDDEETIRKGELTDEDAQKIINMFSAGGEGRQKVKMNPKSENMFLEQIMETKKAGRGE